MREALGELEIPAAFFSRDHAEAKRKLHESDQTSLLNSSIISFCRCRSASCVRGPVTPHQSATSPGRSGGGVKGGARAGGRGEGGRFTQKHYHTNTPFSVGQSERGSFTGPHELRGIRGGDRHSCATLGFYSLRETPRLALQIISTEEYLQPSSS